MLKTAVLLALLALAGTASAMVPLTTYDGRELSVSLPKGWKIGADPDKGVIVAQQDPSRKDAAAALLLVNPNAGATTADQLIGAVASQLASNLTHVQKTEIPGGGQLMTADGKVGDVSVRLGVIAIAADGKAVLCLLVARSDAFEPLGGIELIAEILASIRPHGALPPPPPPAEGAAPNPSNAPPPPRPLTVADLVGEWKKGDSTSISSYYSSTTGAYAGFSAISTAETWNIKANGAIATDFVGVHTGTSLYSVNAKHRGTVNLSPDGVILSIHDEKGSVRKFIVRGWLDGPKGTVLRVAGPFYEEVPADMLADPHKGWNLESLWVRGPR